MARTAHFSLHVLPRGVTAPVSRGEKGAPSPSDPQLSTGDANAAECHVDDLQVSADLIWRFGLVLPKKQARRSVTRSLLRHQARESLRRHAPALRERLARHADVDGWVLRLRAPFDRQQFPSAASDALSLAVRQELDELWSRVSRVQA